jgi:gliding motility-associated-like protein
MLDGAPYTAFTPVPGNPTYAYAQIHVISGAAHNISASQNFNATAYGFGTDESYGYAAGTNLANLYEYVSLVDPANSNKAIQTYGCSDITYSLKVTLPYSTNSITWNFKDGSTPVVQTDPKAITSVKNGQTLYTYTYAKTVKYAKGDYTVIATVFNAGADECGQNEDIEFDFSVVDPPPIVFGFSSVCLGDSTRFTYPADPNDPGTKTYSWDFGDGTPLATVQNPAHAYAGPGDYKVVLNVTNSSGCLSVSPAQTVSISKKPVAAFAVSSPDCAGGTITFTDQSTVVPGTTEAAWSWDFGDGQTSTDKNPTHAYTAVGTYHITLITTNNKGCSSEIGFKDMVIHSSPVADFVVPDVCLSDITATFNDASTIDDHTESAFTYLWNFGDDASNITAGNPNTSTLKNASHKYNTAKQYNVTLTVTSKYGCVAIKTQQFTVNGALPKAAFKVENPNTLCSASDVIFDDKSTVDFGNITKMIWYFDFNNHPNDGVVLMRSKGEIPADGKFTHNYGLFNTPLKLTYAVKLVVYSGESCINESDITNIVINANPIVTLSAPAVMCQEFSPIQIAEDKHGFDGKGLFTGPGVSSTGSFKPAVAGPGVANINYVFTANTTGCTYTITTQILVNPSPIVNAGSDVQILDGAQTRLNGTASGKGLTYQWVPATGLDNPTALNPVANPTDDITYTLIATSADGCSASSTVKVFVLKMPEIPNTFTPNNDGINDLWYINHLDTYPGCTVEVFNRNGEKLYSSVGYSVPWDGRFKGADLPVGVYYYIINPKNGRKTMSGYVTIIR